MSVPLAAPMARLDYRVRVAAALLRSATRREHLLIAGMALTSTATAWPLGGALYPAVAVPASLALAALMRHHLDGLDSRRDALAAAGANPADTLVIQITGPLGAASAGAFAGSFAAVVLGHGRAHAVAPLAMGLVAALLIRRTWLGAPALAAGSLGALVTALVVRATMAADVPAAGSRSRIAAAHAAISAWTAFWLIAPAAVLVLAGTQAAIVKRDGLKRLGRRLAAAVGRRLTARRSA
ncbi:MAG: hypothetical protein JF587_24385 [Catenulisporales bacterium]|nr:hypothetical protein [Catenulisporales bacterium]